MKSGCYVNNLAATPDWGNDRLASLNALRLREQFPFRDVTGKSIQKETLPWTPSSSSRPAINVAKDSRRRRELSAAFRVVHSDKELFEKLGRKDPCPCGSGRRFQKLLHANRPLRRIASRPLSTINSEGTVKRRAFFLVSVIGI